MTNLFFILCFWVGVFTRETPEEKAFMVIDAKGWELTPRAAEKIAECTAKNTTVKWVGLLVAADGSDMPYYGPTILARTGIEIGLRSDGVVVWRRKP